MRIRKKTGEIVEVDDGYRVKDGEALIVDMKFIDSLDDQQRAVMDDQHVADAQRKSDECAANFRQAMADIRERNAPYFDACAAALRAPPSGKAADAAPESAPSILQPSADDIAAARARLAAVRAEHNEWLQNAWKGA